MVSPQEPYIETPHHLRRPFSNWLTRPIGNPEFVWCDFLEDETPLKVKRAFIIEVQRAKNNPYRGVLLVFDHDNDDKLLGYREVPLLSSAPVYGPGAPGPDIWQVLAAAHVDWWTFGKKPPPGQGALYLPMATSFPPFAQRVDPPTP